MLRSRLWAFACLATLFVAPVQGEALKSVPEAAPAATVEAATSPATEAIKAADKKLEQSAAAVPEATTAPAVPETAPAATAPAAEAAKAAEPAKAEPPPLPDPTMTVAIDLGAQLLTVSEHGVAKYSWPISSGTSEFPTPRGTFRPQWTAKMWYSRKYDNAPMPHAVFINGGVAVHATYHTGALGRPASHGCIRLAPANAKTFYGLVHKHGLKATKVSVYGTPKWGKGPSIASRTQRAKRYASAQQDNGWFWGNSSYNTTSAYDPGFANKRYRKPARQYYYAKVQPQQPRIYRKYGGQKYVYVQKAPRKVYYYNNSGYGYGGGGW